MTDRTHPYSGALAALATKHHKLPLIQPALRSSCGLHVVAVEVDTDVLGTFTGDIERDGSPLETAIRKARMGMEASGLSIGLANEGSFGPYIFAPMVIANVEIVVCVDDVRGIVISESDILVSPPTLHVEVGADDEWEKHIPDHIFPSSGVIVRPVGVYRPIVKGITDIDTLSAAVSWCAQAHDEGRVIIESDLRAHYHPSRRDVIASAATKLANRLATLCPQCKCPGWGVVRSIDGTPCAVCKCPTRQKLFDVFGCASCSWEQRVMVNSGMAVDPEFCPMCNP